MIYFHQEVTSIEMKISSKLNDNTSHPFFDKRIGNKYAPKAIRIMFYLKSMDMNKG